MTKSRVFRLPLWLEYWGRRLFIMATRAVDCEYAHKMRTLKVGALCVQLYATRMYAGRLYLSISIKGDKEEPYSWLWDLSVDRMSYGKRGLFVSLSCNSYRWGLMRYVWGMMNELQRLEIIAERN